MGVDPVGREELLGEERVAVGTLEGPVDEFTRRVVADDRRESARGPRRGRSVRGRCVRPCRSDRARRARRAADGGGEVVGTVRADEDERRGVQAARQEHEQVARRAFGPVEILEHEQRRDTFGQPFEHAEELFEERAGAHALLGGRVQFGQQRAQFGRGPVRARRSSVSGRACGASCAAPARSDRTAVRDRRARCIARRARGAVRRSGPRVLRPAATCRRRPRRRRARLRPARRRRPTSRFQ